MTAQVGKYPKRAKYGVGFTDKVPFERGLMRSRRLKSIIKKEVRGYVKDRLMSLERANKILESAGRPR